MPTISIVLPVYKVEKYIGDCIESIAKQTYSDFELIIVDDSSPDRSIEIAKEILDKTRIEYKVITRPNGGLSAARNTGIVNSTGEYLVFVDSDDIVSPVYLETLYRDVSAFKTNIAIASFKWVDEKNKKEFDVQKCAGSLVDKKSFLMDILRRKIFNYFGCFIIRRDYIMSNKLFFDETVFFGVDQAYMWKLMVNVEEYSYNKCIIYNYFNRPSSIMTGSSVEKMVTGLPSLKECAVQLKDNPYFNSEYIVTRWTISVLHTIAKKQGFDVFSKALDKFGFVSMRCLQYPDFRIKALFFANMFGKRTLYNTLRTF